MKKEKVICANFAVTSQIAKVTSTVHEQCLVKMKRHYICVGIYREKSYYI